MLAPVFNPKTFDPELMPVPDLEFYHNLYQNAYGHLQPATLPGIVPAAKLLRINAVNAAYLRRSRKPIQQHFNF
jgi:hypothetical protein